MLGKVQIPFAPCNPRQHRRRAERKYGNRRRRYRFITHKAEIRAESHNVYDNTDNYEKHRRDKPRHALKFVSVCAQYEQERPKYRRYRQRVAT